MARLTPSSRPAGAHYRNFAIGVLAVAAVTALASDGGSNDAQTPGPTATAAAAAALAARTPINAPAETSTAWQDSSEDAAPEDSAATEPPADADAAAQNAAPARPKPGSKGPADQPTAAQLERLMAASRLRSGAPEGGD